MTAIELNSYNPILTKNTDSDQVYGDQVYVGGSDELMQAIRDRKAKMKRDARTWREIIYEQYEEISDLLFNKSTHGLILSVLILMISTTAERVSFKMGVDLMIPFRMFLACAIVTVSAIVYGMISIYKIWFTDKITPRMWQFPKLQLLYMAIIDTISFTGLIISAAGVTPTMTVILLHASTPVIVFMSNYAFPSRKYSPLQTRGAQFICLAMAISVTRSILEFSQGTELKSALCSIMYAFSAAIQGLGTLYKEKAIIEWGQQLDIHFLSARLYLFQMLTMAAFFPLFYLLQGVSSEWSDYPISSMGTNIIEGIQCLSQFGTLVLNRDVCPPQSGTDCGCDGSFVLVVVYVLSNVVVLECINNVLQYSNQILGRVMAVSVLVAFLSLGVYDNTMDSATQVYVRFIGTIGYADILSVFALIIGIDYMGRDAEPNVEMITTYDPVEDVDDE